MFRLSCGNFSYTPLEKFIFKAAHSSEAHFTHAGGSWYSGCIKRVEENFNPFICLEICFLSFCMTCWKFLFTPLVWYFHSCKSCIKVCMYTYHITCISSVLNYSLFLKFSLSKFVLKDVYNEWSLCHELWKSLMLHTEALCFSQSTVGSCWNPHKFGILFW